MLTVAGVEQKTGNSKAISADSSHASSSEALHLRGLQEDLHIWSTREVRRLGDIGWQGGAGEVLMEALCPYRALCHSCCSTCTCCH